MKEIEITRKKGVMSLEIKGQKAQEVNIRELQAINSGTIGGVVKLDLLRTDPAPLLAADLSYFVPLDEFLRMTVLSRRMFAILLNNILRVMDDGEKLRFSRHLFVYDPSQVMIEPSSWSVYFIYVPIQPFSTGGSLKELLVSIPQYATFDREEDTSYVDNYVSILNNGANFSTFVLEEYVKYLDSQPQATFGDDSLRCPHCNSRIAPNESVCVTCGYILNRSSKSEDDRFSDPFMQKPPRNENNGWGDSFAPRQEHPSYGGGMNFFGNRDSMNQGMQGGMNQGMQGGMSQGMQGGMSQGMQGGMNYGMQGGNRPFGMDNRYASDPQFDRFNGTMVAFDFEDRRGGRGSFFGSSAPINNAPPPKKVSLMRFASGTVVVVDKFPFRIGKLQETSDFRIENTAVSRQHAQIVCEHGQYFIMDLNSKNGTYVNGRRLASGAKEPLKNGDSIKLANEELVLYIE